MKQILSLDEKNAHPAAQETQVMIILEWKELWFHLA
jgi:hypothetical protein